MIAIFILLHLLGQQIACGEPQSDRITRQNCNGRKINVVSFVNSDLEIGSTKKSLDDVPSLAVLANKPHTALPQSFTICSDIMSAFSTIRRFLMFFNLLRGDEEQLFPAVIFSGKIFYTTTVQGWAIIPKNQG